MPRKRVVGTKIGNFFIESIVTYRDTVPVYSVLCDCGKRVHKCNGNIRQHICCSRQCGLKKKRTPKPRPKFQAKLYQGRTAAEWVQMLGITKRGFYKRLAKYGSNDHRLYRTKQ